MLLLIAHSEQLWNSSQLVGVERRLDELGRCSIDGDNGILIGGRDLVWPDNDPWAILQVQVMDRFSSNTLRSPMYDPELAVPGVPGPWNVSQWRE